MDHPTDAGIPLVHPSRSVPRLVAIGGSTRRPSSTAQLAEAIGERFLARREAQFELYDLIDAGPGLGAAYKRGDLPAEALRIVEAIESCDALIVASPVYKGSYPGLLKHLFDFVDQAALAGRPVALAGSGANPRHALMVDYQMRPLFGFFSCRMVATSIYACGSDFTDGKIVSPTLLAAIDNAAAELAALVGQPTLPKP